MAVAYDRPTSFEVLTGNLFEVLAEIAALVPGMEIAGWRGQLAHVPPAAWLDMQPTTTTTSAGRVEDRIQFELWFTLPPLEAETSEFAELTKLVDIAIPIVDVAVARSGARDRLGLDFVERTGFAFRSARTATTEGDPGDVPALVITIAARWPATTC